MGMVIFYQLSERTRENKYYLKDYGENHKEVLNDEEIFLVWNSLLGFVLFSFLMWLFLLDSLIWGSGTF